MISTREGKPTQITTGSCVLFPIYYYVIYCVMTDGCGLTLKRSAEPTFVKAR